MYFAQLFLNTHSVKIIEIHGLSQTYGEDRNYEIASSPIGPTPLHSTQPVIGNEKAFKVKIFPSTHAFRSIIFSEKTAVISNKNSHYTGIAEDMVKIPSKPKFLPGFLPVVQWRQHPTGGESHMFHSRRGLRFFFLCSTLVTTENYICLMIFYIVNLFINMLNIG